MHIHSRFNVRVAGCIVSAALFGWACGGDENEESAIAPGTTVAPTVPPPAPEPPRPRGLVASQDAFAGFPLPEGVTVLAREERRLLALVPGTVAEARRYVGERVFSGRVTALGSDGAIYYNSIVRAARGGTVHMDITVNATQSGTQLEIAELPPAQTRALSQEELEAIARREMLEGR